MMLERAETWLSVLTSRTPQQYCVLGTRLVDVHVVLVGGTEVNVPTVAGVLPRSTMEYLSVGSLIALHVMVSAFGLTAVTVKSVGGGSATFSTSTPRSGFSIGSCSPGSSSPARQLVSVNTALTIIAILERPLTNMSGFLANDLGQTTPNDDR